MLLVGTFLAAVTIMITAWVAYDRNQDLTAELENNLEDLTKVQAAAVSDGVWNLNRDTVREILAATNINRDFHSARVITQNGKVFAEFLGLPMPAAQLLTSTAEIVMDDGGVVRSLGLIEVTISLERLTEQQWASLLDSLKTGLIQLIAAVLGTGLVLRRIIGPLESIRGRLITLAEGETDLAIPAVDRDDQIGDMARAVGTFRGSLIDNKQLRAEEVVKKEELERAKQEVELASRAKSDLMANMSHELRTPLNAIIGFSQVLKEGLFGPMANDKQAEYVNDIHDSGQHLLELINDVLDVAAVEAGKLEIQDENLDVGDVVKATMNMVKGRADEGAILLTSNVGDRLPIFRADKRRLMQIFLNLMSNAIKFTPRDGEVSLVASLDDGGAHVFTVADTGIGMDEEGMIKAMSEFGQVDSGLDRKQEGTGLGLPLTQRLVELHGGTFAIESEKGKGTTVTVRFPPERTVVS
jgi:signal transduction histidine kinase